MKVLLPRVLDSAARRISMLARLVLELLFSVKVATDEIGTPLAKRVVYLKDHCRKNLLLRVQVPEGHGVERVPKELGRSDKVCMRI